MSMEVKELADQIMRDSNGGEFEVTNGCDQVDRVVSIQSHLSLLTSDGRDFLISPNGTQVSHTLSQNNHLRQYYKD